MPNASKFPATGYISDAAANNAEILFGSGRANVSSVIDLINIVQSAVMNECLVASPMAMKRSGLLTELGFADTFHVSEEGDGDAKVIHITAPWKLPEDDDAILVDIDERGEPASNSGAGDLLLATAWSEALQDDEILGSLILPERLAADQPRAEAYFVKFAAFMCWLQTDRGLVKFADEEGRQYFADMAEEHLHFYRLLARRLIACRDRFGLDLTYSVIEEPLFSLSLSEEANEPLEFLQQFDATAHDGIVAARKEAFERWRFPPVGAAVLARCKSLDDLPKEIAVARDKLLKARSAIRAMNLDLLAFEREMKLGDDTHFKELNRLKVTLQRALRAFGEDTEYRREREAYPVTEFVWSLPKLLAGALGAIKSPEKALAEVAALPWMRRQSFLRSVPGMKDAAKYVRRARTPVVAKIIDEIAGMDRQRALVQCQTLDWARDLIRRCVDLRDASEIGNKAVATLRGEPGEKTVELLESVLWITMISSDAMRETFFPPAYV